MPNVPRLQFTNLRAGKTMAKKKTFKSASREFGVRLLEGQTQLCASWSCMYYILPSAVLYKGVFLTNTD